ncbi:MAG: CRISPR-associated endoribonuclease Cas6, partial [Thermoplasmata archaeon]
KRNKLFINYLTELSELLREILISVKSTKIKRTTKKISFKYKFITFSLLQIPNRTVVTDYIIMNDEKAYFYISSPNNTLLECIKDGLIAKGTLSLAGAKFEISSIRVYAGPKFIRGTYRFSTLSPVVIRATNNKTARERKILYLYATDRDFKEALKLNLIKRFISYYHQVPLDSTFEIKKIHRFKPVAYRIGNRYYRGNRIIFDVFGSPELLRFAYESGLGEETFLGFGMLKCLAEPKTSKERYYKKEEPIQIA